MFFSFFKKQNKSHHPDIDLFLAKQVDYQKAFVDQAFLVLDFETTGLNPKKDHILSIGYCIIKNAKIQLGESGHYFCKYTEKIPKTAVKIHHITEQKAKNGTPLKDVLDLLLKKLSGKVLVAHYADIETQFLSQAIYKYYNQSVVHFHAVDTLQIAYKTKYQHQIMIEQNALTLNELRKKAKLPAYQAHNALSDAVATAELLICQVKHNPKGVFVATEQLVYK